jgi:hypothetical protein
MIKKILTLLLIINLNGCGYSPMFKYNNDLNFKITKISFEGNRLVNNSLKSKFGRFLSMKSDNHFEVSVNSFFNKKEISKNTKGEIDIYKIQIRTFITVKKVNTNDLNDFEPYSKEYSFNEEFLQKSKSDKFEEKKYETSIVENLTDTIFDKFIISMINK